jgi:hypothetical protein
MGLRRDRTRRVWACLLALYPLSATPSQLLHARLAAVVYDALAIHQQVGNLIRPYPPNWEGIFFIRSPHISTIATAATKLVEA